MKKDNNKKVQSVNNCNNKKVSGTSSNKITNRFNNEIGFEKETKSFQLYDNDEHSFELK